MMFFCCQPNGPKQTLKRKYKHKMPMVYEWLEQCKEIENVHDHEKRGRPRATKKYEYKQMIDIAGKFLLLINT